MCRHCQKVDEGTAERGIGSCLGFEGMELKEKITQQKASYILPFT
jgi:hypothetical protein